MTEDTLLKLGFRRQQQEIPFDKEEKPPSSSLQLDNTACNNNVRPLQRHPAGVISFTRKKTPSTSIKTKLFRRQFYPDVSDKQWNDWHWQVTNRIHTAEALKKLLVLSAEEQSALDSSTAKLPVGITPYYLSLLSHHDASSPLRRSVIPTVNEFFSTPEEADDPLGEEHQSPVPGLVHRYPDRVLLLALDFCSTYCRYCTRSRFVGHGSLHPTRARLEKIFDYISANPQIRDVLISGGDPLIMSDERLNWILTNLRNIPHVEIVRIGTKVPAVLPQRITPKLVRMLRRHHPLLMSLHFTHPDECTPESYNACGMLADAGIPLGSQTVLLLGINDNVETMQNLVHSLLRMRVKPYYLYQCDPIPGSSHFRTTVEKGIEIIKGLRGFTSGYAIPTYVIDALGGGGKIPIMPDYVEGRDGDNLVLRNNEGCLFKYPA
jgi:lysine 2,3-aminomutase